MGQQQDLLQLTRELFIECNWNYDVPPENRYGYFSVMLCLQESAKKMITAGKEEHFEVLELLAHVASMTLIASSPNEPFTAYTRDFRAKRRSVQPEDFLEKELFFFEDILNDVNEPLLKARLADLLWLLGKPRNHQYAKAAIDSYIANIIDDNTWNQGIKECWERAARLCIQIKDFARLERIKEKLCSVFFSEYQESNSMVLSIAYLLNERWIEKWIDSDLKKDIASSLHKKAIDLKENGHFYFAEQYFKLASEIYQSCSDEQGRIRSLIAIAECLELEADSRSGDSHAVANFLYKEAMQAYRNIPRKHRDSYGIEEKIIAIRTKITTSGQASLSEMGKIKTLEIDISDTVNASIEHVAGKPTPEEALAHFAYLRDGPEYGELVASVKEAIQKNLLSNLFASNHRSNDGRITAKIPSMNLSASEDDPANQAVLRRKIQELFSLDIQIAVNSQIMPALRQLCMEHRFTKELMISICHTSPIVPKGREQLLAKALWLGFEEEFDLAIHILCPQFEHIVRSQLKTVGAHTSNIDNDGIEDENGLGTLMELPEAVKVFGENLTFEIKSIFIESMGSNLRNQVAHGLLDDETSSSTASVYAWWMILRLVIRSIIHPPLK